MSFFKDVIRFSLPLMIIWLLVDTYVAMIRVRRIQHSKSITAHNPVEAQLLQVAHYRRRQFQHLVHQLHNQQQEQLNHDELYSHEIKNALASLQATAENQDTVPSSTIFTAVHQANYHLNLLLSDERLAMSNHDFSFEWIDLTQLITTILKDNSAVFIHHQLMPRLTALTGVRVLTDRKWLRFCINQLLTNAIKYSANGATITFKWSGNTLQIIDQGVGISSSDMPRILENGFSGHNGHQSTKSTGMGLYLVKKVTDQLNFNLSISSQLGQGTQASLHFPASNVRQN